MYPYWNILKVSCLLLFKEVGCIFCETGIRQSLYFILSVIGAGMLGVVALFLWSWARGQYKNVEAPKFKMLELELIQKSKIKNQNDKPKTKK